jgi:hypothetical protein
MIVSIVEPTAYGKEDFFKIVNGFLTVNRKLYNMLQEYPLKTNASYNDESFLYFSDNMQPILDLLVPPDPLPSPVVEPTPEALALDAFLGSLGVSMYYPHRDNRYTEELRES